jgi:uracil-DNA glycosylase family 4
MDAREQLRRYLEQRRELGETELVLDSLSVEEALAILGARASGSGQERGAASRPGRQLSGSEPPEPVVPASGADWRAALRATGAEPPSSPRTAQGADRPDEPAAERPVVKPVELRADSDSRVEHSTPPNSGKSRPLVPLPTSDAPGVDADGALAPAGLVVGATSRELFGSVTGQLDSLEAIAEVVAGCTRCPLYATATRSVPGEGNAQAELMLVGEAPGATEDETGRPFVGQAGQLLTKILAAIELKREEVFICNVLKHRPPNNRNPTPEEVAACSPYLIRQIELVRPKVLLALGTFASQTLLETKLSISKLRGQIHRYYGVPLIVTYHPAALLRNPAWKRPTWEDVQLARRILDRARADA